MTLLRCDRCGNLFDPDGTFMTVEVDVLDRESRETIEQVLLCESCADAVGDALGIETMLHRRTA